MKKKVNHITRMKPFLVAAFVLAALASFGVAYTVASNMNESTKSTASCDGLCVDLHEEEAKPATIAVPLGSTVQFNSADGKSHSLSLGKGGHEHVHKGKFNSGEFSANEAWRVEFSDEGTFVFHDHLNPKINVLVVVFTPGKEYKI